MTEPSTGESAQGGAAPARGDQGGAHAVVLAISAAAFAFLYLLSAYLPEGISEEEESRIFVLSCLLVPLSGTVFAWAMSRVKRRFFATHGLFYPSFAFAHAVFWALAVHRLRGALPVAPPKDTHLLYSPHVHWAIVVWLAGNVVLFAIAFATRGRRIGAAAHALLIRWIDRSLPFLVVAALLPFAGLTPLPRQLLLLLAIAGLASFVHVELSRFPRERSARYVLDVLVLVGITLVVFDPAMDADPWHSNFYLGPVAAVRAGRSVLVDINCQYGVGVLYFIAMVMDLKLVAPTIAGFALIMTGLSVLQYAVLYASLRCITRSLPLSALVLALIIFVPRFVQTGYPGAYPSTGPLRFLHGYLLLGCFALRGRLPRHRTWVFALEALVIGTASVWSVESFVYVVAAYLASLVYETAHVRRGAILRELEERLTPVFVAVTLSHAGLLCLIRMRSGEWPHWWRYFEFVELYTTKAFGALPVEPWTPWLPMAGVYAATVIVLAHRRITLGRSNLNAGYAVVFAMSSLGIAHLTYYVGRSHLNNLFHIAAPSFFVAGYWFIVAARKTEHASQPLRQSFVFACYGVATLLALSAVPDVLKKFDHTLAVYVASGRAWETQTPSPLTLDAVQLIRAYAPSARRVALFSTPEVEIETFLLTKRTSVWPISNPFQDMLLESAKARLASARGGLAAGDVIFVETGSRAALSPGQLHLAPGVHALDRELFAGVASTFGFEIVEARASGMTAVRLTAR